MLLYVVIMESPTRDTPRTVLGLYKTHEAVIKAGVKEEKRYKGRSLYDIETWKVGKEIHRTFSFEFDKLKKELEALKSDKTNEN